MEKKLFEISTQVPLSIFYGEIPPRIYEKVLQIFKDTETTFDNRYNEIISFLKKHHSGEEIVPELFSKENILDLFKVYFFEHIINEAIPICFSCSGVYDSTVSIVRNLLTKENLEKSIMGEPMIDAFCDAIKDIKSDGPFGSVARGSTMLLLEKEFLNKDVFKGVIS